MKATKKALLMVLCAALLVAATVMGTIAYLTDTEAVTNTFTVGQVGLSLDELDVDNSTEGENDRDQTNEYHLLPGHTYVKDPIVHVDAESDNCWLFVVVDNQIEKIEGATANGKVTEQIENNGWIRIAYTSENYPVFAYKKPGVGGNDYPVFSEFKIRGEDVDNDKITEYAGKHINVTAYAVQKDGFNTALDAWNATFGSNP